MNKPVGIINDKIMYANKKSPIFDELLESVKEGGAILRGEKKPSRAYINGYICALDDMVKMLDVMRMEIEKKEK